jgi:hypothetical protein
MGTIVRAKSEMFAQQLIMNDERRMMNDVEGCRWLRETYRKLF